MKMKLNIKFVIHGGFTLSNYGSDSRLLYIHYGEMIPRKLKKKNKVKVKTTGQLGRSVGGYVY